MGSPGSQMADRWPLARGEVCPEMKMVHMAIFRVLLVFVLKSSLGKWACFVGKHCCLGAPMGAPRVPDS